MSGQPGHPDSHGGVRHLGILHLADTLNFPRMGRQDGRVDSCICKDVVVAEERPGSAEQDGG
ncbi:MAG: hypothetical protein JWP30_116 [Homoserinimonas sp.]|nr:hypothetical protein [Homoserinimonas sp.]